MNLQSKTFFLKNARDYWEVGTVAIIFRDSAEKEAFLTELWLWRNMDSFMVVMELYTVLILREILSKGHLVLRSGSDESKSKWKLLYLAMQHKSRMTTISHHTATAKSFQHSNLRVSKFPPHTPYSRNESTCDFFLKVKKRCRESSVSIMKEWTVQSRFVCGEWESGSKVELIVSYDIRKCSSIERFVSRLSDLWSVKVFRSYNINTKCFVQPFTVCKPSALSCINPSEPVDFRTQSQKAPILTTGKNCLQRCFTKDTSEPLISLSLFFGPLHFISEFASMGSCGLSS